METYTVPMNDWLTYVGVNDRLKALFENQWPIPNGVAYNSYVIRDEKNVLLDCVDIHQADDFLPKLSQALDGRNLDYLIINHMEPDHSSSIPLIRALYPDVTLVGNKKTFEFLDHFYGESAHEKRLTVKEGDVLSLGQHELKFYQTPMTHWPESMVSYETTEGILFSQDIFGGFGALEGGIFDDEIGDLDHVFSEACRYYANIVGKYSQMANRSLNKLSSLEIQMICPVHGPIWRTHLPQILKLYESLTERRSTNGVVVAFGTMYGNTERMADALARYLTESGIQNVKLFDLAKTHNSIISAEIWKYRGFILCAPTYNNALFLPMKYLLDILGENKMANKTMGIVGNYSWSGGAVKEMKAWAETQPFELLEPVVEVRSAAKEEDMIQLRALAAAMAENLKIHADVDADSYFSPAKDEY